MVEPEEDVEQTLHVARSISVYRIPPRPGANGWRSGEWLVSDKLFCGRMRILAKGDLCEIKLEDPNSGELFVTCPIQYGQRNACVEPVTDSSRYYVLRVEDSTTHRHAFLGMGFDNRSDAFDFNEALVRHELDIARERAARAKGLGTPADNSPPNSSAGWSAAPLYWAAGSAAANSSAAAEVEGLYRNQTAGLQLHEGQTIRVNISGLKKAGSVTPSGGSLMFGTPGALAPPPPSTSAASAAQAVTWQPGYPAAATRPPTLSPPPTPNQHLNHQQPEDQLLVTQEVVHPDNGSDAGILGCALDSSQTTPITSEANGFPSSTSGQDNWATFE